MKLLSVFIILLSLLCISCFGQSDSTFDDGRTITCIFETQPSFPGGTKAMLRFFGKNLMHPEHEYVEGTVYVSIMVNEDGSLSDFTIVKGVSDQCDQSAIGIFKKMPKWIPAKQGDKPVKVRMILPLKFTHS
ncbi:MAG: hypothetical protein DI538_21610 [Azospira oryzae]|nr:MAG: hypothetical protein DI538_21610 [Azospira oryzae]